MFKRVATVTAAAVLALIPSVATSAQGDISTAAGDGTAALFDSPNGVAALPEGGFLFSDTNHNRIRKVDAAGMVSTVYGDGSSTTLSSPHGIAVASDGFFVADAGNHRIVKVDGSGAGTVVAGTGHSGFSGDDGAATSAELYAPRDVSVAPNGDLLIADWGNCRIRKVTMSTHTISTVAGIGCSGTDQEGVAATAGYISLPRAVAALPGGGFLIADSGNSRVRKVGADGIITTVAGTGTQGFGGDGGAAASAKLAIPSGLSVLPDGGYLIADTFNHRIRKVDASGTITTVAGSSATPGFGGDGGAATTALLNAPRDVTVTADGGFLVADTENNRLRTIAGPDPVIPVPATPVTPTSCVGKHATIIGTAGADVLVGTAKQDVVSLGAGDDVFKGKAGNDIVCGGDGNDAVTGGAGNDKLIGDAGNDVLKGGLGTDKCDGGTGLDIAKTCERRPNVP